MPKTPICFQGFPLHRLIAMLKAKTTSSGQPTGYGINEPSGYNAIRRAVDFKRPFSEYTEELQPDYKITIRAMGCQNRLHIPYMKSPENRINHGVQLAQRAETAILSVTCLIVPKKARHRNFCNFTGETWPVKLSYSHFQLSFPQQRYLALKVSAILFYHHETQTYQYRCSTRK